MYISYSEQCVYKVGFVYKLVRLSKYQFYLMYFVCECMHEC